MTVTTRQPGIFTGLSLLFPITLSVMAALFVAPIAPKIGEALGPTGRYTPAELQAYIGAIITTPALFVALLCLPAGWLGDRIGRRKLLIWCMGVYSVVGVLPYFLNDLRLVLLSRAAVGIVEAGVMTLSTTLIGDYYQGAARNRWLAAQTACASLSALIVFPIAGIVGARDWHNVFLLYLLPLVFLGLLLAFTWEPEESAHLGEEAMHGKWSDLPWGLLGVICTITLFGAVMFYTVQIELSAALKELGVTLPNGDYDSARGGLITMAASLGVPLGTVLFMALSQRLTLKWLFVLEFLLMGTGFVLMSMVHSKITFTGAAFIDQLGAGMVLPTLLTWAVAQLPFAIRGRGTGLWTATFTLGQFVCNNAALPSIMRYTHTLLPAFGVLGWACLAAMVAALIFAPTSRAAPL
ncbi:MAG: MFS transporter [Alphaproteobacteria bacterium]|nr:MFS transporter [Alphaproteobacteria bacterium]